MTPGGADRDPLDADSPVPPRRQGGVLNDVAFIEPLAIGPVSLAINGQTPPEGVPVLRRAVGRAAAPITRTVTTLATVDEPRVPKQRRGDEPPPVFPPPLPETVFGPAAPRYIPSPKAAEAEPAGAGAARAGAAGAEAGVAEAEIIDEVVDRPVVFPPPLAVTAGYTPKADVAEAEVVEDLPPEVFPPPLPPTVTEALPRFTSVRGYPAAGDDLGDADDIDTDDIEQSIRVGSRELAPSPVLAWTVEPADDQVVIVPEPAPAYAAPQRFEDARPAQRRRLLIRFAIVLAAVLVVLVVAYLILAAMRPRVGTTVLPLPPVASAGQTAGGASVPTTAEPSGGPVPATPAQTAGPSPVASDPGPTLTPSATATSAGAVAELHATYSTVAHTGLLGLSGYRGQVDIANSGGSPADGWVVVISLPSGATIESVDGAEYQQDGTAVTFTPVEATRTVPAGESIEFTFEVPGLLAGGPTGCSIDGQPCG